MSRILIVDDEANIRAALKSALSTRGHEVVTAADCKHARQYFSAGYDIIFLDIMLPDGNGIDLLRELLERNRHQTIVMISGHADINAAVKAIRIGAFDFIEKPLSLDRVLITVDNASRTERLVTERNRLSHLVYGELIGKSSAMQRLREDVLRSAPRATRFLVCGENGTGKELTAHLIHRYGRFSDGPFIAVNCAALPTELIESELFGHMPGAFTGAVKQRRGRFVEADHGTIFLDEIGDMPLKAQAKLLRVLESGELTPLGSDKAVRVDCITIAASNRNLQMMIEKETFREDLYYRLSVVTLQVPSLRERREDIPALARHFLGRFSEQSGEAEKRLNADALEFLNQLEFRGNIRELKNLMERVTIYCQSETVSANDIQPLMPDPAPAALMALKEATDRFELEYIQSALARNNGNVAETARQLGLERSHLYKKLKRLGD